MNGEAFLIRPMHAADAAQVLRIAKSLKDSPRWPRSAYLTALDPHAAPRRVALVAADPENDSAVGSAIASLLSPEAELETIAVVRDRQRQGLGRRLLDRVFRELRQEGAREVWLEVRESNQAALGLYRRAGFAESGRRRGYYAEPVEDAIVMRLTMS